MQRRFTLLSAELLVGCGTTSTPAPRTAAPREAATADAKPLPPPREQPAELLRDPFAVPLDLRGEPAHLMDLPSVELAAAELPAAPASVPPAPKTCDAWVARKPTKTPACTDEGAARTALAEALGLADDKRDAALAALEGCAGLPKGIARSIRAEFAPVACADALVAPMLAKADKTFRPLVVGALQGHLVAGRLARLPTEPPTLGPPFEKQRVLDHIRGPVAKWLTEQSEAVEETSRAAQRLTFYGRALAALEAGMADLRMVEAMRAMPVSDEIAKSPELRSVYDGALEESLDPRKARGRDAVLVALADFASIGALADPRVARARSMLTKMYGGRRIDALDALWIPPINELKAARVDQRLAIALPTFYSAVLFDAKVAADESLLLALAQQGVPGPTRKALATPATPEARKLAAKLRLRLGQTYWRAFDFDESATLMRDADHATEEGFLLALALALRGGPENAAAMMRRSPEKSLKLGDLRALELLAKGDGPLAGLAAYDATYLRELTAPTQADAAFWDDLEKRYLAAAEKITIPAWKKRATAAAKGAADLKSALKK